jgi:hypothetical protein
MECPQEPLLHVFDLNDVETCFAPHLWKMILAILQVIVFQVIPAHYDPILFHLDRSAGIEVERSRHSRYAFLLFQNFVDWERIGKDGPALKWQRTYLTSAAGHNDFDLFMNRDTELATSWAIAYFGLSQFDSIKDKKKYQLPRDLAMGEGS